MKTILLPLFICIPLLVSAQITFEEITAPDDFNFNTIRQSPQGEYFVQAANDLESIYTSMDGQQWTKSALPDRHALGELQFYSDGTPVLSTETGHHLIRRDGAWYELQIGSQWEDVTGSFVKGDSLFVFQNSTFYYSLNKGLSFVPLFTYAPGIVDHRAHLWKLDHHFALHHSAGASDYLSVFNEQGVRVLHRQLNLSIDEHFLYNNCNEVLILDRTNYYRFEESTLQFVPGKTDDITPEGGYGFYMTSQNGHYYYRFGGIVYKTTDCNFNWSEWKVDEIIGQYGAIWISDQEDVFLNKSNSDHYVIQKSGSADWDKNWIAINYPRIYSVDQAVYEKQAAQTPTALFTKKLADLSWNELMIPVDSILDFDYSPDGRLYILKPDGIISSADNGQNFSHIFLPAEANNARLIKIEILDNEVLLLHDGIFLSSFYSSDNGATWTQTGINLFSTEASFKLVGDQIFIAGNEFGLTVSIIDVSSGLGFFEMNDEYNFVYPRTPAILDDGTIYFSGSDFFLEEQEVLVSYQLGKGFKLVGYFPELINVYNLVASGQELFGFGPTGYYHFNGASFDALPYAGLPGEGGIGFILAKDQYLYAVHGTNRIFRSTEPLTRPKQLSGVILMDDNEDCNEDPSDLGLDHWRVKIEGDEFMTIRSTDSEGRFCISVPEGEYKVSSHPVSSNWTLCASEANLVVNDAITDADVAFQTQAINTCATLEIDFSTPRLRRCFENYYQVRVRNTGPADSENTTATIELDPFFEFISASIPWTVVSPGVLQFELGVLTVNEEVTFRIDFKISCDAELGQEHCMTGVLQDPILCEVARSYYEECQENIGSYDPNDKRMFNDAGQLTTRIDTGEYIQYHIRFQNTGSDTAFDVRVLDPLSPQLDLSTFEMLSASHPYTYEITDGPDLLVEFENILLPDSTTNEPASHGFFKFRIKPLASLGYGTTIPNEADIYFDFNEPVNTGEVILHLSPATRTHQVLPAIDFIISPNPVEDFLSIHIDQKDLTTGTTVEVLDLTGRTVMQSLRFTGQRIDVGTLGAGMYNVLLKNQNGMTGMKSFVKVQD